MRKNPSAAPTLFAGCVALCVSCATTTPAPNPAADPAATPAAPPADANAPHAPTLSWLAPGDRPEDIATRRGVQVKYFDLNHDGHPDVYRFYTLEADPANAGGTLEHTVRKELDVNQDGHVDVVRTYNANNQLVEELDDLDFDGRVDQTSFFTDGNLARKELDLDFDGKPDVIKYYATGHLIRIESDRNHHGKMDTWEYYENDALDRVGMDNDGDGQVDSWQRPAKAAAPGVPSTPDTAPSKAPAKTGTSQSLPTP